MKTSILICLVFAHSTLASADSENTHFNKVSSQPLKIESRKTEPTPIPEAEPEESPDPVDQPPVLGYAKPTQQDTMNRTPAAATPQKFVDSDLGVACYYLLPTSTPGVVSPGAPAISCVKLPEKKEAPAPQAAPANFGN